MAEKRKRAPRKTTAKKKVAKARTRKKAPNLKVAALRVDRMPLSELSPHPRNVEIRKHPEKGTAKWNTLAASLAHDYFDPLVYNVRNGFLVSGHLRLKVMTELGFEEADIVVVDYDEPTHIARMLSANKGAGDDDEVGQRAFLFELKGSKGFDLDLTGFDNDYLDALLGTMDVQTSDDMEDGDKPSSSREVDTDFKMNNKCPKCGFEFDTK